MATPYAASKTAWLVGVQSDTVMAPNCIVCLSRNWRWPQPHAGKRGMPPCCDEAVAPVSSHTAAYTSRGEGLVDEPGGLHGKAF